MAKPHVTRNVDVYSIWDDYVKINNLSYGDLNELSELDHESIRSEAEELAQAKLNKLDALGGIYQLANRVLTRSDISVKIVTDRSMEAPAWSNGVEIFLNAPNLADVTDASLIGITGVNYHELSHIIWTPRAGSDFMIKVLSNNLGTAMNMLEDMRIESFMSVRFPSTKPYLLNSFLTYVVEGDVEKVGNSFPLSRGRKFIPIELRQHIANKFVEDHGLTLAIELSKVIDEYRTIIFPRNADRAFQLVERYANLLGIVGNNTKPEDCPWKTGTCGGREPMKSGRADSVKDQQKIVDRIKHNDKSDQTESLDSRPGEGEGGFAPSGEGKDDGDDFVEKANETIKRILSDSSVKDDVRRVRSVLREGGEITKTVKKANFQDVSVEASDVIASHNFAEELSRLCIESDPAWDYETPSGKLNIQRAMNFDITKINTLFDRWHEGNPAFDIESVILTDNSGSMAWVMEPVLRSTWVIKRALESIDADVSVYTFNSSSSSLYDASEKAKPGTMRSVEAGRSTNPTDALIETERIMLNSKRNTKIVFILTDGVWDRSSDPDRVIKRLNDAGVMTVLVYLGDESDSADYVESMRHHAQHLYLIQQPRQLVGLARELVTNLSGKGK